MNILIIKLGALGDIVMATPLIDAIARAHHDDNVLLLTTPAYADLFSPWSNLQVATFERHGIRPSLATIAWIKKSRSNRIYDLQGNNRTRIYCAFSGASEIVGNHGQWPYTHYPNEPWQGQSHIFERMCEVLASVGISDIEKRPILHSSSEENDAIAQWLTDNNLTENEFVVLHAGASASRPEKVWPYFEELGKRLFARGLRPVWVGAGDDGTSNRQLAQASNGIDATDRFTITGLTNLGCRARFAVTNDSGPMHVLSAGRIPVFGLFGPSDWRRNHAIGQSSNVIACVELLPDLAGQATAPALNRLTCDHVWQRLRDTNVL